MMGEPGKDGLPGRQGETGMIGIPGSQGPEGREGPPGYQGPSGATGRQGQPGISIYFILNVNGNFILKLKQYVVTNCFVIDVNCKFILMTMHYCKLGNNSSCRFSWRTWNTCAERNWSEGQRILLCSSFAIRYDTALSKEYRENLGRIFATTHDG